MKATEGIEVACSDRNIHTRDESVKQVQTNTTLLEALTASDFITIFQEWEKQRSRNAMFKAKMNYLHRVEYRIDSNEKHCCI